MNIKPSLILSYKTALLLTPKIFSPSLKPLLEFGESRVGADLYLFMESDLSLWVQWVQRARKKDEKKLPPNNRFLLANPEELSARQFLSMLEKDDVTLIATKLFDRFTELKVPIVAITSFIPEVSTTHDSRETDRAMLNLMRFAMELNVSARRLIPVDSATQFVKGTPVLQIVCGSLFGGLERISQEDGKKSRLYVKTLQRDTLLKVMFKRLSKCYETLSNEYAQEDLDKLRIAAELEPGQMNLLGDKSHLSEFLDAMYSVFGKESKLCGFNLDAAHWWMLGHSEQEWDEQFESREDILERVYHAHISGHSPRGHLGDFSLKRLSDAHKVEMQQWLRRIAKLNNSSWYVSLEFEAAKCTEDVTESMEELIKWIDAI